VELRALEKYFAAAGISLSAESEVKLTVCIGVPPEMARIGHLVEITISREAAMTGIGKIGPVSGNGRKEAEVSDRDYTSKCT
jgi:hypothetical protein